MMFPMQLLGWVLLLVLGGLLLWFGIWLNGRLKLSLKSLPWLAVFFALSFGLGTVEPRIFGEIMQHESFPSEWGQGNFLVTWFAARRALQNTGWLIGVLMLFSELAPLLARSSPVEELQTWDPLKRVRASIPLLGVVLIVLAVLPIAVAGAMLAFSGSD
ncbi:MAG: hypothetical protein KY429_12165 [Actinobacteria bacterium]|nr:hypothetical protein [Actinomycetota bacterium]